jgi:hypothetical protein
MPKGEVRRRSYRYRTRVLVGDWQASTEAAIDDAIRAGQARVDPGGEVRWVVPGRIESGAADNADLRIEGDRPRI